ncbi:MAG TPA: hypothetical protein VKR61_24135 [Bryobacteraceae bacterium]|nr:hypothetical protein [Bryobacteraceae bacterium]
MTRRCWIFVALLSSACRHPLPSRESLLPANLGMVWTRTSLRAVPPPQSTARRAFEATYRGPGELTVQLYETKVSAVAFEMTQHWKPEPDTVFFAKGNYFVIVKWLQADRPSLTVFIHALQDELQGQR